MVSMRILAGALIALAGGAHADVRLNADWPREIAADGTWVPDREKGTWLMANAAERWALELIATPGVEMDGRPRRYGESDGFRLFMDDTKYYIKSAMFMARTKLSEVCTPTPYKSAPIYRCDEGQPYTRGCHIFLFNERFERSAHHAIAINERFPYFCNAMPAMGVGDKANNIVLVTVQYFNTERKPASSIAQVGSSWRRMTVALRIQAKEGQLSVEQDDRCLGNPNQIETIPEARRKLRGCGD